MRIRLKMAYIRTQTPLFFISPRVTRRSICVRIHFLSPRTSTSTSTSTAYHFSLMDTSNANKRKRTLHYRPFFSKKNPGKERNSFSTTPATVSEHVCAYAYAKVIQLSFTGNYKASFLCSDEQGRPRLSGNCFSPPFIFPLSTWSVFVSPLNRSFKWAKANLRFFKVKSITTFHSGSRFSQ